MSYLRTKVLSHAQLVRKLYKDGLRQLQAYNKSRISLRYESVLLRERFDKHKDEKDMMKAKKLLLAGEEELFRKQHPQPFKYAHSPGGICFGRKPHIPDAILDTWHPLEKAQYPEYFARREIRKQEYIERWEKKYGKPAVH